MPIRTDSRQQARLQSAPVIPTLPPEPSLESFYSEQKTNGLTRVFQTYDRARKEWSARVGQHLGRIQDALVKLSSRSETTVQYPNMGWAKLVNVAEGLAGVSSLDFRPQSASISLTPYFSASLNAFSADLSEYVYPWTAVEVICSDFGTDAPHLGFGQGVLANNTAVTQGVAALRISLVPATDTRSFTVVRSLGGRTLSNGVVVPAERHLIAYLQQAEPEDEVNASQLRIAAAFAELV